MTRMTGPDCAVMCNLINIHTYIHEDADALRCHRRADSSLYDPANREDVV